MVFGPTKDCLELAFFGKVLPSGTLPKSVGYYQVVPYRKVSGFVFLVGSALPKIVMWGIFHKASPNEKALQH